MRTPTLFFVIVVYGFTSAAIADGVYKWTDPNGVTNYSDKPPLTGNVTAVRVAPTKGIRGGSKYPPQVANADAQGQAGAPIIQSPMLTSEAISGGNSSNAGGSSAASSAGGGGSQGAMQTGGGGGGGTGGQTGPGQKPSAGSSAGGVIVPSAGQTVAANDSVNTPPSVPTVNVAVPGYSSDGFSVSKAFFGMHIHRADAGATWPTVPFGGIRTWDTGVTWGYIQPKRGEWRYTKPDALVDLALQNGVDVLLNLGTTPDWASARPTEKCAYGLGCAAEPTNMRDWENYVRAVVTRYKGRVRAYEIWNEPNLFHPAGRPGGYYSGSAEQLVELTKIAYQVIKSVDPSAKVVSPAPVAEVSRIEPFFRLGGGQYIDVFAAHYYAIPPEVLPKLIRQFRDMMTRYGVEDKELWNTEQGYVGYLSGPGINKQDYQVLQGGWMANRLGDAEYAAFLARSLVLEAANGISRSYWYDWDGGDMSLAGPKGNSPKAAAIAYAQMYRWMAGSSVAGCAPNGALWICEFRKSGGRKAWMLWATTPVMANLPVEWGSQEYQDLSGRDVNFGSSHAVLVTPSPVLIKGDAGTWNPDN